MKIKYKYLIIFTIFTLLFFSKATIYAQTKGNIEVNSRLDFDRSQHLYKIISNKNFVIDNHFSNYKEAIKYFENVLVWTNKNEDVEFEK